MGVHMDEPKKGLKLLTVDVSETRHQAATVFVGIINIFAGMDLLINDHILILNNLVPLSVILISTALIISGSIYFSLIFQSRRKVTYDVILSLTGLVSFTTWIYYISMYIYLYRDTQMMLLLIAISSYNLILFFIGLISLWQKAMRKK